MPAVRHSLDPFFRPRSVAVFGASATPGSVGSILMRNLLGNPFGGVVYPINPKRRTVHGVHCYPDLASVPEAVDLAVIATPAPTVPALVADCAARGVPAAIVISAGFSELGAEGRALEAADPRRPRQDARHRPQLPRRHPPAEQPQRQLRRRRWPRPAASPCSARAAPSARPSSTGPRERHIGFSSFVSVGAMLDVDFADLIDYFGDDPATRRHHPLHGVDRRRAQVPQRRPQRQPDQARDRREVGPARGRRPRRRVAHRGAGRGRRRLRRRLPPGRRPPRHDHPGPLQHVGDPGDAAAAARPGAGDRHQRRRPRRHGRGRPDDCAAANSPRSARRRWPPSTPPCRRSGATPTPSTCSATPRPSATAWPSSCAPRTQTVQGVLILLTPQAMTDPTETARQVAPFASDRRTNRCWRAGWAAPRCGRAATILNDGRHPDVRRAGGAIRAFLHMVQYRRNQELLYETPPALPEDWQPDAGTRAARSSPRPAPPAARC